MTTELTQENKDYFISAARMGIACGLEHPYEWLMNVLMHSMNLFAYSEIPQEETKYLNAFLAIYKSSPSCPEEERELRHMTRDEFYNHVCEWFKKKGHPLFQ